MSELSESAKPTYYELHKDIIKQRSREYYARKKAEKLAANPGAKKSAGRPVGYRANLKEKWMEMGRQEAARNQQPMNNTEEKPEQTS